ncbi:MAG: hypothetical protein EOP51_14310 [Sphingobacteriales bacterium]|nr:MAG: hypothetical protein EOP51_14310 [Sphingobacteriales bacterium]
MKKLLLASLSLTVFFGACKDKKDDTTTPTTPTGNVVELTGDISANQTLTSDKKYLLKGFVYVKEGVTLTVQPGTVIMGEKSSKGTLVVSRGGKLMAEGTASQPIVFTSAQSANARREGDWGGIILLGKAPINPAGGEAKIEGGLTATAGGDEKKYIYYGGTDANDNSGSLKYLRIEFAGVAYSPDNEINGLTMGGVGAGTKISYVQVYRSGDDAFEWFGGTVNCDHLVATYTWDDDFDTDFGFSGKIQFGVAQRVKNTADVSGSNGFESDNDANGSTNNPQTKAMFSNMTIIGAIATKGNSGINANFQNGAQIRRNSSESIMNSLLVGYPVGLYIDDTKGTATSGNMVAGSLMFKNNIIAGCTIPFKATLNDTNPTAWAALVTATNTTVLEESPMAGVADAYKFAPAVSTPTGRPSFLLTSSSPALTGADFTGTTGFQSVSYRGAFDGTNDWTTGWTTWAAEATEY